MVIETTTHSRATGATITGHAASAKAQDVGHVQRTSREFSEVHIMATQEPRSYWYLDDCYSCGAAIGPCLNWPWHLRDEDCRAIRQPVADEVTA